MEYYKRLKELRKERKETQTQTAEAAEHGEQKPGLDNLCALADHFGVTLDYLAGRTDER